MKEHYELIFPPDAHPVKKNFFQLPKWQKYRFAAAQSATRYSFGDGSKILKQHLALNPFYIELVQFDSARPFPLQFKVNQKRLFLFFMLEGMIRFATEKSSLITKARKGYFYISSNSPGIYNATANKGISTALVVSIDQGWMTKNTKEYTILHDSLMEMINGDGQFSIMPHHRIGENVNKWLKQLRGFESRNPKTLRKMLEGYILRGLEYYEDLLRGEKIPDVYLVKKYLDTNFCSPDLSLNKLVKLFPFSKRTLYNHFTELFQMTAVQYYTMLRLEKAQQLIETEGIPASEVWVQVGYRDPGTFRQAYYNYLIAQKNR